MTNLSIEEAKKEKWRLGQLKYGPKFVGHPLEELDDELIDAMNYCDVAIEWGYDVSAIEDELHRLCDYLRSRYRDELDQNILENKITSKDSH